MTRSLYLWQFNRSTRNTFSVLWQITDSEVTSKWKILQPKCCPILLPWIINLIPPRRRRGQREKLRNRKQEVWETRAPSSFHSRLKLTGHSRCNLIQLLSCGTLPLVFIVVVTQRLIVTLIGLLLDMADEKICFLLCTLWKSESAYVEISKYCG